MANEIAVIERAEIETFQNDGMGAIAKAKELARAIVDGASLNIAAEMMLESKRRVKAIDERFKKPIADATAALNSVRDLRTELREPYERIEVEILKPAMAKFNAEQDRKRRVEEDKLRAEAKKREEDARLRDAEALAQDGQPELADAVLSAPVVVPPVVLPRSETPAGISYRDIWRFEILDPNVVPREYLTVDEKKIGGVVRALKGETRITGVRVYSEKTVAGRI